MSLITYKCTCGNELEIKEENNEIAILYPCESCLNEKYDEGNAGGWDTGYDDGIAEGEE